MSNYLYISSSINNIFLNNGINAFNGASKLNDIDNKYNETTAYYYFTYPFNISKISNQITYSSNNDDLGNKMSPQIYIYSSSVNNITIPTGATFINVITIGGGGGGTSGSATSGGDGKGGGGGSSGGVSVTLGIPRVSGVNGLNVIVGAGGAGTNNQTGNGNPLIGTDGAASYITYNGKNYCIGQGGSKGTGSGLQGIGGIATNTVSTDTFNVNNLTYNYNTKGVNGSNGATSGTRINRRLPGGQGGKTPSLRSITSNSTILFNNNILYHRSSDNVLTSTDISSLTNGNGGKGGDSDYDSGGIYGLAGSPGVNGLVIIYYIFTPIQFTASIS